MPGRTGKPIEDLGNTQVFSTLPSLNGLLNEENMVKLKAGTLSKEELIESLMGSTPLKQISKGIDVRWEDPVVPRYNGQRSQRVQCSPVPGVETEKHDWQSRKSWSRSNSPQAIRCNGRVRRTPATSP